MLNNYTIVIDLDGTILAKGNKISFQDLKTLKVLSKKNSILLASGRNYNDVENVIEQYKLQSCIEKYIICRNGQQIYDINQKKLIKNKYIDYNMLQDIIKDLEKQNVYWYLIENNNLFCNKIKYNVVKYLKNEKYKIEILSNYLELKNHICEKFIINANSLNQLKNIEELLRYKYNVEFFKFDRKKVYNSLIYWQNNLLPYNTNKYVATQEVLKLLNLSTKIIAFGDGVNDYELLINSDYSVCMENANSNIKNISKFITRTCDHNGFSYSIKKINDLL